MFSRRFLFSILILDNTQSPYQSPPPPPPLLSPFFISLSSRQAILNGRVSCFVCNTVVYLIDWCNLSLKRGAIKMNCYHFDTIVFMVHGFEWFDWCRVFLCIILSLACFVFVSGMQQFVLIALNAIQNYALICATQSEYVEYCHTWQKLYRGHPYESNKSLYLMRINVAFLSKIKISQMKSSVPGRQFFFPFFYWLLNFDNEQHANKSSLFAGKVVIFVYVHKYAYHRL